MKENIDVYFFNHVLANQLGKATLVYITSGWISFHSIFRFQVGMKLKRSMKIIYLAIL